MYERNEVRTANAGYEQALKNMMLEKNRSKGAMSDDIRELYMDALDEMVELGRALLHEGNDRIAEEAGDVNANISRIIEVINYGSKI